MKLPLGKGEMSRFNQQWWIRGQNLFLEVEGEDYPAKSMGIVANGTQDLCVIMDPDNPSSHILTTIPQENIVWKPDGDLFVVTFYEPLPQSHGGRQVLYMEAKGMEPLIEEIMRRKLPTFTGVEFDAFLGKDYGHDPDTEMPWW